MAYYQAVIIKKNYKGYAMKKIYLATFLLCAPLGLQANDRLADFAAQMSAITSVAFAQTSKQIAIKINLAGKQRMLTQKMTKEALLIGLKIDIEKNKSNLQSSISLFEKTLLGLQKGDESLGLTKTQNKETQQQLTHITALWMTFKPSIKGLISASDTKKLKVVAAKNLPLLREMNKAVNLYEESSGTELSDDEIAELGKVINLAGKQRMLTQKMTKELLLIATDIDKSSNRDSLQKTLELFDKTLQGLVSGNDDLGLPATKDTAILKQLALVQEHWDKFKPLIEKAETSKASLLQIAEMNLTLLKEMNAAVKMYEQGSKK
ncbi:MAG TPA: hypothetical protein EYG68_00925 [Leucothrix mucor]|nr:hypothetical protein [Leucothrix mucor]